MRLRQLIVCAVLFAAASPGPSPSWAQERPLTVFAAASLKNALDLVAEDWSRAGGGAIVVSYAASSALARQIAQDAPADIFISADIPWMDDLDGKGLVAKDTRHDLLGNRLVLIAGPGDGGAPLEPAEGFDLAGRLGDGRLAVADTGTVPAGRYAKAALQALGVWDTVESRTAPSENVRAALALVARGEAPLGIVYATDARAETKVRVVGTFPETTHPAIVYPAAVLAASRHGDARAFLEHLSGTAARARFEAEGFTVLADRPAN